MQTDIYFIAVLQDVIINGYDYYYICINIDTQILKYDYYICIYGKNKAFPRPPFKSQNVCVKFTMTFMGLLP